ncbi:hypothetical protein THAOC_09085 [Thalassiosira oceanica]|uniref:Uncharacterized protein n=1 Tax=Thalassiosira oceanica TaxID=159749 RepID=K0T8G7_THAOC|nr:hypothetical protein THAOC_09085 [Thalassiosira oceanica]|eukprot:EJK69636.1 hypothetical protein THAOC_09085 [Thalassiosira oceanica]
MVVTSSASSSAAGIVDLTISDSDSECENKSTEMIPDRKGHAYLAAASAVPLSFNLSDDDDQDDDQSASPQKCKAPAAAVASCPTSKGSAGASKRGADARVSLSPLTTSHKIYASALTTACGTSHLSTSTLGFASRSSKLESAKEDQCSLARQHLPISAQNLKSQENLPNDENCVNCATFAIPPDATSAQSLASSEDGISADLVRHARQSVSACLVISSRLLTYTFSNNESEIFPNATAYGGTEGICNNLRNPRNDAIRLASA